MEYRFSGWSTGVIWGRETGPPAGSEWYIGFKKECDSEEEAKQLEERARAAADRMFGTSTAVERLYLVVFVELKYSRQEAWLQFGTHDSDQLTAAAMAGFLSILE